MSKFIVKHRRGTTAQWASSSIIPKEGEIVIEQCTDGTSKFKIGDGVHTYPNLPNITNEDLILVYTTPSEFANPSADVYGKMVLYAGEPSYSSSTKFPDGLRPGRLYGCVCDPNDPTVHDTNYVYTEDTDVDSETTGTYYIFQPPNYNAVTLPDDYIEGGHYYSRSLETSYGHWYEMAQFDYNITEVTAINGILVRRNIGKIYKYTGDTSYIGGSGTLPSYGGGSSSQGVSHTYTIYPNDIFIVTSYDGIIYPLVVANGSSYASITWTTNQLASKQDTLTFNTAYNATSNKAATMADVISIGDDVVFGYYNPATNKFYEEGTYQTEITPDDDKIYVDKGTNDVYRYWGGQGAGYQKVSPKTQSVDNLSPINLWERTAGEIFYTSISSSGGIKYKINNGLLPLTTWKGALVFIVSKPNENNAKTSWIVFAYDSSYYYPTVYIGYSNSGGSDGYYRKFTSLPEITAADNGKVLKVQDGMWKAYKNENTVAGNLAMFDSNGNTVDSGKAISDIERLKITITKSQGVYSADKTHTEISAALLNDIEPYIIYNKPVLGTSVPVLFRYTAYGGGIIFSADWTEHSGDTDDLTTATFTIFSNNTITYCEKTVSNIPTKTSDLTNDSGFLTAHQSLSGYATEQYVDNSISDLVESAPSTLDTLNELAAALGDDPNFATTVSAQIGTKVDKVTGKGLSTNDYDSTAKAKVDAIPANPQYTDTVYDDTSLVSRVSTIEGKEASWNAKSNFSGNYNDLSNKPTIPSKTSDLTNDSGFLTDHQSLSNYYTKSEVDNKSAIVVHLNTDMTADYTFSQLNSAIGNREISLCYQNTHYQIFSHSDQYIQFVTTFISDSTITVIFISVSSSDSWGINSIRYPITNSVTAQSTDLQIPTAKACWDGLKNYIDDQYGPHTVWEVDLNNALTAADVKSRNSTWQVTNLDLTPYKYVLCYVQACNGSNDDQEGVSFAVRVNLDAKSVTPRSGNYVGSALGFYPNDNGAKYGCVFTVKGDKTSVCFNYCDANTTGTTALSRDGKFYKIEGYKS